MAFKSTDSQNLEGKNRGGKDQKKKMKKMRSIKLPKLSGLNSSSRRSTRQFDLSAIDLAIEELDSMESFDAKKESSQGESESEDTSVSSSSSPLSLDSSIKGGIERKKTLKKARSTKLSRFGSFRPPKRNPKSRFDQLSVTPQKQTPVQFSDASPDISKPKGRSDGRKVLFQANSDSSECSKNSGSLSGKTMHNLTRTPSMRSVRILKSKPSFKSRRPSMKKQIEAPKEVHVERATCSSTLKDSKFSNEIELHEGENEVERISVVKVCPYHHCSLNGHCHGLEPVPKKPFLRRKRHLMKTQKSKANGDEKKGLKISKMVSNEDSPTLVEANASTSKETDFRVEIYAVPRDESSSGASQENGDRDVGEIWFGGKSQSENSFQENDFSVETEARTESFGGASEENEDGEAGEILFGGKSPPEKCFQENLDQTRKFSAAENESISETADTDLKDEEKVVVFSKDEPSTTIATEANGPISSSTNCHPFDEINDTTEEKKVDFVQENESANESSPITDSEPKELSPVEDLKAYSTGPEEFQPRLKKENSISMWHLIHRQMVSGLKEEVEEKRVGDPNSLSSAKSSLSRNISDADMGTEDHNAASQETELRKIFAIKLVREAIEKILLPEVQDNSSDDQSLTSDVISDQENFEKNHDEGGEVSISNSTDSAKQEETRENDNEEEKTARKEGDKSEKRAPKSWSYLKKVILLKRFVKELQKVREFSPRKPRYLPLEPEQEAEKVSLRPQTTGEKRNAEEWMLDYAIRQAVSELAPKQKRKVALLVKAFETVAPPQEDQPIRVTVRKLKQNSQEFGCVKSGLNEAISQADVTEKKAEDTVDEKDREIHQDIESNAVDNVVSTSNCDSLEQITEAHEENNREFKPEHVPEEKGTISSNCHPFKEMNATAEEKKGDSKEECESINGSTPIKDSEEYAISPQAFKPRVKRENHISMWHLIHEQMVSGLAAESGTEPLCGANEEKQADDVNTSSVNNDTVNQETELRKIFAIKLVREAIEKILLPEVQDQFSDDQSTTSDVTSDQDFTEKNHNEDFEKLNFRESECNKIGDDRSFEPKEVSRENNNEEAETERKEGNKSEKQKPKSWSYLKKVILLKRFVKELEKVKKFNPRKPQFLPLEPDQEAEKVSLRPQMVGEKRNTDEWMLDYAIRQVVSQLAPTQKRKVAMLVKAFETVAPPPEDQHLSFKFRDIRSESSGKFAGLDNLRDIESNVSDNFVSSSNYDPSKKVNEGQEEKSRGSEAENVANGTDKTRVEKQNHIKMWHMIYQHVVTGIAEKVGTELLLDGGDEDEQVENAKSLTNYEAGKQNLDPTSQRKIEFSKSDAVKLVQEAVDEILLPDIQDDSSDTQSTAGDDVTTPKDEKAPSLLRNERQKSKNWSKLKKLILLKRSIKALENVRKRDPQPPKILPLKRDVEEEKVDLKSQMVDERKKAEQWMLDYAVQHIVTKLTPARKRRVAMLVEAFEAVVPLPEN